MNNQRGFSLLETLIAMAVLGILLVATAGVLAAAGRGTTTGNEHTVAESIARSQMDSIQNQTYDKTNNPPVYTVITGLPTGYTIVSPMASRLDPKGLGGTATDEGLQQITVTVQHGARTIYTLVDYKVNLNP